ncbi:TonB-dependent receptor family protein [Amphritea japonica]|uniref:Iron complex outermembrane recepter protein n=1 Tax=Amphritea japonica ATCC BAA-1530 TaxID=1278309 RepID=A0A7R6STB9_9GAMM|nr:TonB-dependent receptor [Amphritea japonica]BBB27254.1 iron complex outermembrane recepter protein [Amphritea japonica ATCC BAA-1530]
MKHSRLYQAVLLGTSLISAAAVAQENTLSTVVVSATRSEQSENLAPAMISVIDSQQIARSNANTLADLLRSSGMVQVRDTLGDGSRVSVSMRGFGQNTSNNVLILVDGRRLNNPTLEAPRLSSVAVHDIARIEITHGSAGALYGDQAVGGVINIITKTSTETRGSIQISSGSDDTNSLQANISHSYDNGIGIRLSGKHAVSDGYRDNNDSEFDTYTGELSYQHNSGELFIEKQKINDDLRLPGALNDTDLAEDRRQSSKDDFSNGTTDILIFGIDQVLTDNLSLLGEYSKRESNNYGYLGANFNNGSTVESLTPRLSGEWDLNQGTLYLTGGFDQIQSNYENSWGSKYRQDLRAFYLQTIIPLNSSLDLTLGARHSRVEDKNLSSFTSKSRNNKESATVKEIGLSWQLNPQQRLFVRRDESFRFANLDEHGFTLPSVEFLKPQEGTSWEMGWQRQLDDSSITTSLYHLTLKNEILYDAEIANPFGFGGKGANINLDDSRRQGVIIEFSQTLTPALLAGATYTYTDAELTSGSFKGNAVPFVAEHTLNLFTDYQFSSQWSLFVDGQYTGSRYQDDDNLNVQRQIPEQFILNTAVNYKRDNWFASFKVNNLSNEKYDGYAIYSAFSGANHYPAPERNLKLTLGYRF